MDKATYDRGLKIGKSVLGHEFVDQAIASADDFNHPMQNLTAEFAGAMSGAAMALRARPAAFSILAMLCAHNRPHELKIHVQSALTNGATRGEIREVFMQVAIYCGVLADVDAFRNAREVFVGLNQEK